MASKPTLGQIAASVLDPMLSDNFLLDIANIPGGGDYTALRLQCTSAVKPGFTINAVEVQVFGHTLEFAGNKTFNHDMTIEYVENRSAQVTTTLENWGNLVRDTETQTGAYKTEYARNGYFTIFDQMGKAVREYEIFNMWPSVVPDLSFNGSSSSVITLSTTFKFDYYKLRGGA
jgi:hypothetical protein